MNQPHHYDYAIDPQDNSTANKVLRWVGENKNVLELGTAAGTMTRAIKAQSCTVTGVEYEADMAALAAPDCERIIVGDLDNLDLKATLGNTRFDVIVAADVLEHLRDPWRLLEQIRHIVTPEGHAVFSIPNIGHASVIAGLINGHFNYREKGLLDQTHLRFFTRSGIQDMLLATGWTPIAWESHRVAPLDSEFAHHWQAQSDQARATLQQHPDHDIYQFIIKAIPAGELGWQKKFQTDIDQLTKKLNAKERGLEQCKQDHQHDLASLIEHQKAFNEAKDWISRLQSEIEEKALTQQQLTQQHQQLTQQHQQNQNELSRYQHGLYRAIKACIHDWRKRKGH